jgi:hypothetical protein
MFIFSHLAGICVLQFRERRLAVLGEALTVLNICE